MRNHKQGLGTYIITVIHLPFMRTLNMTIDKLNSRTRYSTGTFWIRFFARNLTTSSAMDLISGRDRKVPASSPSSSPGASVLSKNSSSNSHNPLTTVSVTAQTNKDESEHKLSNPLKFQPALDTLDALKCHFQLQSSQFPTLLKFIRKCMDTQ